MNRKRASLTGAIVRECIRMAMRSPLLKNGGLFWIGKKSARRASRRKAPGGSSPQKLQIDSVPVEWLEASPGSMDRVILQLHGGAYLIGFLNLYRRLARRYAQLSGGASVLTVDYRVAPENHYPAALEDALAAWNWLTGRGYSPHKIIVCGDSAGGNLALALTLKLRDEARELPGALVLMSPWADMTSAGDSRVFNFKKDPFFGEAAYDERADSMRNPGNPYAGNKDLRNPYLSPVYADYDRFPPMLIQVGDWEMLLSDARTVAEKARKAGVPVTLTEYPGMFHVFQVFGGLLPESKEAWKEVQAFILHCTADRSVG